VDQITISFQAQSKGEPTTVATWTFYNATFADFQTSTSSSQGALEPTQINLLQDSVSFISTKVQLAVGSARSTWNFAANQKN
jgi:hypothetical protein